MKEISFEGHNITNSKDRTLLCADLIGNACFFDERKNHLFSVEVAIYYF